MKEVSFTVPVSGVVRIDGDSITILINKAETNVTFEGERKEGGRIFIEKGKTVHIASRLPVISSDSSPQIISIASPKL